MTQQRYLLKPADQSDSTAHEFSQATQGLVSAHDREAYHPIAAGAALELDLPAAEAELILSEHFAQTHFAASSRNAATGLNGKPVIEVLFERFDF